ncbi:MAG: hypothetical protein ACRD0O_10380 [Acidimicrobiia bacterium]
MVLLVLAVLWGIVLLPPALRKRAEARQSRSVENFRKRLEVLAPPAVPRAARPPSAVRPIGSAPPRASLVAEPGPVPPPAGPRPAVATRQFSRVDVLRRRRQVFGGLCLAAFLTLALALAFPGLRLILGVAHLLADTALAAYVTGLRRLRRLARERKDKVRYLPMAIVVEIDLTDSSDASDASHDADDGATAQAPAARSAAL